jgi:hypothetical protein
MFQSKSVLMLQLFLAMCGQLEFTCVKFVCVFLFFWYCSYPGLRAIPMIAMFTLKGVDLSLSVMWGNTYYLNFQLRSTKIVQHS